MRRTIKLYSIRSHPIYSQMKNYKYIIKIKKKLCLRPQPNFSIFSDFFFNKNYLIFKILYMHLISQKKFVLDIARILVRLITKIINSMAWFILHV